MKKNIFTLLLCGFFTLSAHADSFSIKDESKQSMPTEADFYNGCV